MRFTLRVGFSDMNEEENQITHMDILAFINGWDLVSKDNVNLTNELEEKEDQIERE